MNLEDVALGYAAIGALAAIACAFARRLGPTDGLLCAALWPLYLPFLLVRDEAHDRAGDPGDAREAELLAALARARTSPLGAMLPDADSARVLAHRLREAGARLGELEAVLARPDFDPAAAERRVHELVARGAGAAAATAGLRVRTLGQLRALRLRYRAELDDVSELVAQLVTQAELVRLDPASATAAASTELVRELVDRLEGLGELMSLEPEYPDGAGRST